MRIALLADPHGNREALAACLNHAEHAGAERFVFLGDLVGYGADPAWVVETVARYHAAGALVVVGNHDQAVLDPGREEMHDDALAAVEWTRAQLDAAQHRFLGDLPLTATEDDRLYVHANAWQPAGWAYLRSPEDAGRTLDASAARIVFCGHIHTPALYHRGPSGRVESFAPVAGIGIPLSGLRRWVVVLGAVGQPRDGNPAACYATFDSDSTMLTMHRVPYDTGTAARKIREAGLPDWLGARLEVGG